MIQPFHTRTGGARKIRKNEYIMPGTKNRTNGQTGGDMARKKKGYRGLQRLIEKFRNEFKRPENTDFYSETDYKAAEREYVKLCLEGKFEFYNAKGNKP
jgi:hypothetical protein